MTGDEVGRVLAKMTDMFANRVLSEGALETWTEELAELDFSAAYAAARQVAREAAKMPTPAEFRGLAAVHARRQKAYDAEPEHVCPSCDGAGWLEVKPGTPPTVKPCPTCRRITLPAPKASSWTP